MHKKLISVLLILFLISALTAGCSSKPSASTDMYASMDWFQTLETTDINGNPVTSSIFADNELTLVNLWTTT